MKLKLLAAVLATAIPFGLPAASSANSFGYNLLTNTSCSCTLHGEHSDIHFPDTDGTWHVTENNFGVMRISAERGDGSFSNSGLIQAGGNISNSHTHDDCASDSGGHIETFIEHKSYPAGAYLCDVYVSGTTGNHTFRVQKTDSCSGCWAGWVSGIKKPDHAVGIDGADIIVAGGEVETANNGMVVKGTYGQTANDIPWERTATIYPNTPTWTSVGSGAICDGGMKWNVESAPTPFQVNYSPTNYGCS